MGDYDVAVATAGGFHLTWADNRDPLAGGAPRMDPNVYSDTIAAPSGTITVTKRLVSNALDPAKFNLQIDGTTYAANVGNGGTTGAVTVSAGTHSVSETPGTNANLGNYTTKIACSHGSAGNGTSLNGIQVNAGDNLTCTITNTRKLFKVG
jgi:prealbumin domain-containing protein